MAINKAKYSLNKNGEFIIENYNSSKPFASFFPGIAGLFGIPMWVFYVNRGQGIVSFGTEDKNHSIAEFLPANEAWQRVSLQGFRTFFKVKTAKQIIYYEPFQDSLDNTSFDIKRSMKIKSYELELEETNSTLGINIAVRYFTLPGEPIAGLIRQVTVTNIGKKTVNVELVDGLPKIIPYGTANFFLKKLSRTIEAWMRVVFLDGKIPFYNLRVDPADRPETTFIEGGNFYLPFYRDGKKMHLLKTIIDPVSLFDTGDFSYPRNFVSVAQFKPKFSNQIKENKIPCAFSYLNFQLKAKASQSISSIIGHAHNKDRLKDAVDKILADSFFEEKQKENETIIKDIENNILTKSGCGQFDLYAKQTFLDNVLRGGYPISFKSGGGKNVFYVYSRKHGDLERDYNNFVLAPTYFSQGNGNYRDMNQNRRSDNWFSLDIPESNLVNFINLIQVDGFNPLVVKGLSFILDKDRSKSLLKNILKDKEKERLAEFFNSAFNPGELLIFIEDNNITPDISKVEFINKVISLSKKIEQAEHGEGFWTDHWTYNLDLIENYLSVYPEKLKEISIDKKVFTFFDNTEIVQSRADKYILTPEGNIRQHHSVIYDSEKAKLIGQRLADPQKVRSDYGKGDVIYVNLLNKLLCLFVNKLASLDAQGIGIEMEANKPNWFDSLNGLPALFGSSTNETFELKRLVIFIEAILRSSREFRHKDIMLLSEVSDFLKGLGKLLKDYFSSGNVKERDFIFWDKAYSLKEAYRKITKLGFSGKESGINLTELFEILDAAKRKITLGLERAFDKKAGLYHTYFINEVTDYTVVSDRIKVKRFRQTPLAFFLEAQVHALRIESNKHKASSLYRAIRTSNLYDKKLNMYKVCASLKKESYEIGRCRVFTPGWLENESIWLHMEYKFLLELLRGGLHDEFYKDFFNCLVPFLNPKEYGRSILENSSFIVSSVFPDTRLHGNGFVARLSGSTAEFINIWRIINTGMRPFSLDNHAKLTLELKPILHKKLFTRRKTYSFMFLGKTMVTYHSSKLANTYGRSGLAPQVYIFKDEDGELVNVNSSVISHPYAQKIRNGLIKKIDVYLA